MRAVRLSCIALGLALLFGGCAETGKTVKPEPPATSPPAVAAPAPESVPDAAEAARVRAEALLVGKWKRASYGNDTIEFKPDGSVSFYSAVERTSYPGVFRVLDKDRMEITLKKGSVLNWTFSVGKNELTLTTLTGVEMKYRRTRGN